MMDLTEQQHVFDWGEQRAIAQCERADRHDPSVVRSILHIDLQTFSEATFSQHSASALLRHGEVFLLRAEGDVIGTCVLMRTWESPDEALLLSMGILPGWRGRGLGQFFVAQVLRELAAAGVQSVLLQVGEHNRRAVGLYREVGFETVERIELSSASAGSLVMRAKLTKA
jgi:ribosomal protein S18 acetylase RimI-like enzyme